VFSVKGLGHYDDEVGSNVTTSAFSESLYLESLEQCDKLLQ